MYIGDYNEPLDTLHDKALVAFPMVMLALGIGCIVGMLIWATLSVSHALIHVVWSFIPQAIGSGIWFAPIVCACGGLCIGLWNHYTQVYPNSLEGVMAQVKETGSYQLEGGLLKNIIGFLLPLTFGGSIGPEAGLTGIIAGACTWISNKLKHAGIAAKSVADLTLSASLSAIFGTPFLGIVATTEDGMPREDQLEFRRGAKIVLYTAASFGALAGIALIADITGSGAGLPRFDSLHVQGLDWIWIIPCVLVAYILALIFHGANHGAHAASQWIQAKITYADIVLPTLCGIMLGLSAAAFPFVLFSGEAQSSEIQTLWLSFSAGFLLITAVIKVVLTPTCIHWGWRGGMFFPIIFSGICAGYGLATLTGIDPMFSVTVTTTALVAAVTQKPLMAIAILMLCFPLDGILWMGLTAVIGAALPIPRNLETPDKVA